MTELKALEEALGQLYEMAQPKTLRDIGLGWDSDVKLQWDLVQDRIRSLFRRK